MSKVPDILLDSDVTRHFHRGCQLDKLPIIYPKRLAILDKVKDELIRSPALKKPIEDFIKNHSIKEITFPANIDLIKEYARLKGRLKGDGESSCLSYAKFNKGVCIASSNIYDVTEYCKMNNIKFVTTMDILITANKKHILSVEECNEFISKVRSCGSKLPEKSLQDFVNGGYEIREI